MSLIYYSSDSPLKLTTSKFRFSSSSVKAGAGSLVSLYFKA